jgi:hypothetical protein
MIDSGFIEDDEVDDTDNTSREEDKTSYLTTTDDSVATMITNIQITSNSCDTNNPLHDQAYYDSVRPTIATTVNYTE